MEFHDGAKLLATVLTPPYQFTWNNVGVDTYSLTAKAYSTRGLSKTSPATNVTVSVKQLPVVSLLTPANNARSARRATSVFPPSPPTPMAW